MLTLWQITMFLALHMIISWYGKIDEKLKSEYYISNTPLSLHGLNTIIPPMDLVQLNYCPNVHCCSNNPVVQLLLVLGWFRLWVLVLVDGGSGWMGYVLWLLVSPPL